MLILESSDAAADAQLFQSADISASPVLHFEREGQRPEIGFATCQQEYPENFWNPAYQQHPNGANGVSNVTIVASDPAQHRAMLLAFTGVADAKSEDDGYAIPLSRGSISVMTLRGFAARLGVEGPDPGPGARLAAISFSVPDLNGVRTRVQEAGTPALMRDVGLVVRPENALGATLLFTPAG
jgi:hypothetical protein